MTDKTYDQELEELKSSKNKIRIDLTMNDVPVHIVNSFRSDVKKKYGDIYWVKLMDLMRKAEFLDFLMAQGSVPQMDFIEEVPKDKFGKPEDKDEDKGIYTFEGRVDLDE